MTSAAFPMPEEQPMEEGYYFGPLAEMPFGHELCISMAISWAKGVVGTVTDAGAGIDENMLPVVMAAAALLWEWDEPWDDCGRTWSDVVRSIELGGFVTKAE